MEKFSTWEQYKHLKFSQIKKYLVEVTPQRMLQLSQTSHRLMKTDEDKNGSLEEGVSGSGLNRQI